MHIHSIYSYPIKSLPGISMEEARFNPSGGITGDRRYQLTDENGRKLNGKRFGSLPWMPVKALAQNIFELNERSYQLDRSEEREEFLSIISERLRMTLRLEENEKMGFPDDHERSGPTLVSLASLEKVAAHFGISVDNCIARFRPNIILSGAAAFEEEQWVGKFLGNNDFKLEISKCCPRCRVPGISPETGEEDKRFASRYCDFRMKQPPLTTAHNENPYLFAMNTRLKESGNELSLRSGMELGLFS